MTNPDNAPIPGSSDGEMTDHEVELEIYDLDGDGEISMLEAQRARLGPIDARLQAIAAKGGLRGKLAGLLHKLLDRFDND